MLCTKLIDKNKFVVEEIEDLKIKEDSVLIQVKNTGICGSDIHHWDLGFPKGLIMGHEFSGVIIDKGTSQFNVGDRVIGIPISPCNECEFCKAGKEQLCVKTWDDTVGLTLVRNGGYASHLNSRVDLTLKLPDSVSFSEGAMIEPLSVALHAVNLAHITKGEKVLIVGGGIIGLLCAEIAKLKGASHVTLFETNKNRGKKSLKYDKVDIMFDATNTDSINKLKNHFDKTIECCGNEKAVNSAINSTKSGGKVILVGVSLENIDFEAINVVKKELSVIGSICYTKKEFIDALKLVENKKVNVEQYIDKFINQYEVQDSFLKLVSQDNDLIKIMIKY